MNPDIPQELVREDLCCDQLFEVLKEGKLAFAYNNATRELQVFNKAYQWVQSISYCPFCGVRQPKSLHDLWEKQLEAKFGDAIWEDDSLMPEAYKSDRWWKDQSL